jgi:DNA-binding NarL/FixJ family response regulator
LSNKEIATALNIAEVTVKLHVSHVLEKLNVKDRTQAATEALKRGIIYS